MHRGVILNPNTKKYDEIAQKCYLAYKQRLTIFDAYKTPSDTKIAIWCDWLNYCNNHNYEKPFIVSYNAQIFTLGYFDDWSRLHYITPTKHYVLE